MSDAATLTRLLEAEDASGCAAWLLDLAPEARRALAPAAWARHRQTRGQRAYQHPALTLALAACAEGAELARRKWPLWPNTPGLGELLLAVRPEWLGAWVDHVLEKSPFSFPLVLELVRAGACAAPASDAWIEGLMGAGPRHPGGPAALLRQEPALLAQVWRLFEVEGGGERSLAACDKYSTAEATWQTGLLALAAQGELGREALLDATLAALARDFAPFRAGWHSRFHEALGPTPAEQAPRQAAYRGLLGSQAGPTVALALAALEALEAAGRLDRAATLEALAPAVMAKAKGTARRAVELAGRLAAAAPSLAPEVAALAAQALAHPAREVQAAALGLCEAHAGPDDADVTQAAVEAAPGVAPSLRGRLEAWSAEALPPAALEASAPAPEVDPDLEGIPGVDSRDELEALLLAILKSPERPEDLERALAGAARFGAGPPGPDGPRLARAAKAAAAAARGATEHCLADGLRGRLASLAHWVATRKALPVPPEEPRGRVLAGPYVHLPELADLFGRRIEAVLRQLEAGLGLPPLATPTHRPAWVAPGALAERLGAWEDAGQEPDVLDLVQALLRLAPGGRAGAARAARGLRGLAGRALRYALGENVEVGDPAPVWVAAGQARTPGQALPEVAARHPGLGPDVDAPMTYTVQIDVRRGGAWTHRTLRLRRSPPTPDPLDPRLVSVLVHTAGGPLTRWTNRRVAGFTPTSVRLAATVSPAHMEWFFAEGAEALDPEWNSAQWEVVEYLRPLLRPDLALGPMAHLLVALGLGAKETGQRQAAVEALVQASAQGRLGAAPVGQRLCELVAEDYLKASRITQALNQAAHAGGAEAVRAALAALVPPLLDPAPRGIGGLLELWHELLVAADATWSGSPATRRALEALAGKSSKTGRAARGLQGRLA